MESIQERITLNIGGIRYETYLGTLQAFPGTKLCRLTEPDAWTTFDYDPRAKEFFFDRNPGLFDEVLNYYRTKHLHCPGDICRSVFENELAFWEIDGAALDPCCWEKLNQAESQEEEFVAWEVDEGNSDQDLLVQAQRRNNSCWAQWQAKTWALFENPCSSLCAKWLAGFSLVFNIGICILFIVMDELSAHANEAESPPSRGLSHLLHLELFCVLWFISEFLIRLTCCPKKTKFLRNLLNVADFISLFPVNIEFCLGGRVEKDHLVFSFLKLFRVAYFFKLLKIIKLVETPLMLRVLSYTSRSISKEVLILMLIWAFEFMISGVLVFYTDIILSEAETHFASLLDAFWWAIITLTMVGYGDMYPITSLSKVIAACTALCGILTFIITISVFLIKFKRYYHAALIKERRKKEK